MRKYYATFALYEDHPVLKKKASELLQSEYPQVDENRSLYVEQYEYAIVRGTDTRVKFVGSDRASTCHIIILHHKQSKDVGVAHFDGSDEDDICFQVMVGILLGSHEEKNVDVYAIGGVFHPDRHPKGNETSQKISRTLLSRMRRLNVFFNIKQWCCCELNTHNHIVYGISQRTHGLCWDLQHEEAFAATFRYRGPDESLRSACVYSCGGKMRSLYNSERHQITIRPFASRMEERDLTEYLHKPNEDIMWVSFLLSLFSNSLLYMPCQLRKFCDEVQKSSMILKGTF